MPLNKKIKPNQSFDNFWTCLIYHHHHQIMSTARNSQTLSLCSYHLLRLDLPNYIQCPHRADVTKFLLVSQYWYVHVQGSMEEYYLWVCLCFYSSVLHVLFILLGWFLRWEVSGQTTVVLEVLLPGLVWNSSQHSCIFSI